MLLRLACENGKEEDFDAIDANIREIESYTAPEDREKRSEASLEFFRLITKAGHNEVLVVVSESLTTILRHVLKADTTRLFRPDLVPVRKQILCHLRERDSAAAEREMTRYFDEMRRGAPAAQ
jgi:DNA-binding FadR family transcriptional regulator